jgi:hypothetical protein
MTPGLSATKLPDGGSDGSDPVFLLGTERSGTNLVRRILDTHSGVCAPHPIESSFPSTSFPPLSPKAARPFVRDTLICMYFSHHTLYETIDIDDVVRRISDCSLLSFQRALYEAFAAATDSERWMTKWSSNIKHVYDIDEYYDDPKYIHLVRDCRDNVLSKKNNEAGEFHPYFSARRWRDEQERILEFSEDTDSVVHLIRYEDLLDDPEASVKSLCESLGLEYEPAMLLYHETDKAQTEAKKHHAFENLDSPIKSGNYGKFHDGLSDEELLVTESVAGDYLEELGYSLATDQPERESLSVDPERYRKIADQRKQNLKRDRWRTDPKERLRMSLRSYFRSYMSLRYVVPNR